MLEPQSTVLFVLLIALFGALIWRTLATRRTAVRVLAACLAFVPAMVFGVLGVNKYHGYYQTWGAMVADFTRQGASAAPQVPHVALAADSRSGTLDGSRAHLELAQREGYLVRTTVTGPRSGISRVVYVYLPPQYFQPAYRAYRFPVIELIHGQPGVPQDWITVVGVTRTFDRLLADKLARPAVLVMPDANGGDGRLRDENTPLDELPNLPAAAVIPRFWLAAGAADGQDVLSTERFWQELRPRQPDAPLTLTPGSGHTMTTWRAQIPSMLSWMTPRLARAVSRSWAGATSPASRAGCRNPTALAFVSATTWSPRSTPGPRTGSAGCSRHRSRP